jgi:AcrR family transcriptional regulator
MTLQSLEGRKLLRIHQNCAVLANRLHREHPAHSLVPCASLILVPAVSTRKQVLTDLRRHEILTAAIKVFGRKGFADTCVDDIATAAKIAKGTIYLYFKSKEDMYATAIQQTVQKLQQIADEKTRSAHGIRDRLTAAISIRVTFWEEQQGLYRLLLTVGREQRHRRQTNDLLRTGHDAFFNILKDAADSGELPPQSQSLELLDATAWAILDMVRGFNERRLDRLTTTPPEQDAATITAITLQHLGL